MTKVTIIGSGSVGSTIAYTLTVQGIASEIVMIDINGEKAMGEALDIRQGTPFCNPCTIYAGSYSDAAGSDIVILTSGVARSITTSFSANIFSSSKPSTHMIMRSSMVNLPSRT